MAQGPMRQIRTEVTVHSDQPGAINSFLATPSQRRSIWQNWLKHNEELKVRKEH